MLNILTIVYVALFLGLWFEGNDDLTMAKIAYNQQKELAIPPGN